MDPQQIYAIERPHSKLLRLYLIRSFLFPPLTLLGLPMLYFRYHTMRYKFDDEGISMSWGILFRRQINLTYRRIQDIHLTSGVLQRWLGLADIHIQTASGSASAEMTIEGLLEAEDVRDFLYSKMRGAQDSPKGRTPYAATSPPAIADPELIEVLNGVRDEIRHAREALEASQAKEGGGSTDV